MPVKLEGFWKMILEFFPGKPHWNLEDIPDQTGKVIIVTGGNTGIGFETAKALLANNATVYIGSRSVDKGNKAIEELKNITKNQKAYVLQMDLADLTTIPKAVEEFRAKENKLHILINNAGILGTPMDQYTKQGYDLQFGTNVLGHYLLTKLLLPVMESTAAELPKDKPVRIVELTSDGHLVNPNTFSNVVDYGTLQKGPARDRSDPVHMYVQSKSGNLLSAKAKARILQGKNIIAMAVNPGRIHSGLNDNQSAVLQAFARVISYPTPFGALSSCYAATYPDITGFNGSFFGPWARIKTPRTDHVNNIEAEDKLVAWLEEQLKINHIAS